MLLHHNSESGWSAMCLTARASASVFSTMLTLTRAVWSCQDCPADSYQNNTGSQSCFACPSTYPRPGPTPALSRWASISSPSSSSPSLAPKEGSGAVGTPSNVPPDTFRSPVHAAWPPVKR
eukprot:1858097-Rhodomonas_salina.1